MAELHEQLLARVHRGGRLGGAVLAVLALHKPWIREGHTEPEFCEHCPTEEAWPCSTVRAVAEALGIGETS